MHITGAVADIGLDWRKKAFDGAGAGASASQQTRENISYTAKIHVWKQRKIYVHCCMFFSLSQKGDVVAAQPSPVFSVSKRMRGQWSNG